MMPRTRPGCFRGVADKSQEISGLQESGKVWKHRDSDRAVTDGGSRPGGDRANQKVREKTKPTKYYTGATPQGPAAKANASRGRLQDDT